MTTLAMCSFQSLENDRRSAGKARVGGGPDPSAVGGRRRAGRRGDRESGAPFIVNERVNARANAPRARRSARESTRGRMRRDVDNEMKRRETRRPGDDLMTTTKRALNFNAGPATLPLAALERAQA